MLKVKKMMVILGVLLSVLSSMGQASDDRFHVWTPDNVLNTALTSATDVAVSRSRDSIYVLSGSNIKKLDAISGQLLLEWRSNTPIDEYGGYLTGIAIDSSDNIYVVNSALHRIEVFSSNGVFLRSWGGPGSGSQNGQFYYPQGITIDSDNNVYVADSLNHRIQKFNNNGTFLTQWGNNTTPGYQSSADGEFSNPEDIASNGNYVYVADTDNHRIQKFEKDGTYLTQWGNGYNPGSEDGQFRNPRGITANYGKVFVSDTGNRRIQEFDEDGVFLSTWGSSGDGDGEFFNPNGITVLPGIDSIGYIYVADNYNDCVQKFNPAHTFISKWSTKGSGNGLFDDPRDLTTDALGNVYVIEHINERVQKFDKHGTYLTQWGTTGTGDGQFRYPRGIAADKRGNIFVSDYYNHRIQKFDIDGPFLSKWGSFGDGDGQFKSLRGITTDSEGNVYTVDDYLNRVQKFNNYGVFLTKWGSLSNPVDIAIDKNDNVYVIENDGKHLHKFNSDGVLLSTWYPKDERGDYIEGEGIAVDNNGDIYISFVSKILQYDANVVLKKVYGYEESFNSPRGISIDKNNNIYTADTGNNRIQIMTPHVPVTMPPSIIVYLLN